MPIDYSHGPVDSGPPYHCSQCNGSFYGIYAVLVGKVFFNLCHSCFTDFIKESIDALSENNPFHGG